MADQGNGNRLTVDGATVEDWRVYRLPSGELVRATVEPDDDHAFDDEFAAAHPANTFRMTSPTGVVFWATRDLVLGDTPGSHGPGHVVFYLAEEWATEVEQPTYEGDPEGSIWRYGPEEGNTGWTFKDLKRGSLADTRNWDMAVRRTESN